MKGFLQVACLVACLFCATACDSIGSLSSAIRRGWESLKSNKTEEPEFITASSIKPHTGTEAECVARAKEVQAIATELTSNVATRNEKVKAKIEELDKIYPAWQPITADSMETMMQNPAPESFGSFSKTDQLVYPLLNEEGTPGEELIPDIWFRAPPGYSLHLVEYTSPKEETMKLAIMDRGGLGGWARSAHWYYLLQGKVGKDEEDRGYYFSGLTKINGHDWVVWKNKKNDFSSYLSWWKDRWMILLLDAPNPDAIQAINPEWLETVK